MSHPDPPGIDALLVHEPLLRSLARAVLRGDEGVEDGLQDTWATALAGGPRRPGALRGWLARVTRNFALKRRGREGERPARERAAKAPSPVPSPEGIAEREEVRRQVLSGAGWLLLRGAGTGLRPQLPHPRKAEPAGSTFRLPAGTALDVYTRTMPPTWRPDGRPPASPWRCRCA